MAARLLVGVAGEEGQKPRPFFPRPPDVALALRVAASLHSQFLAHGCNVASSLGPGG